MSAPPPSTEAAAEERGRAPPDTGPTGGPFLVGCCPSSGSTLLSIMLDAHEDVLCGPELAIFSHPRFWTSRDERWRDSLRRRLGGNVDNPRRPDWSLDSGFCPFVDAVYPQNLPWYGVTPDELRSWVDEGLSGAELATRLFERALERRGATVWAEKSPPNLYSIPLFLDAFPRGRAIVVVRDGRDVVCSLLRRQFCFAAAAATWTVEAALSLALSRMPRVHLLRYEDLVMRPREALDRLTRAIGIRPSIDRMLRYTETSSRIRDDASIHVTAWQNSPARPLSESSIGRWRSDLVPPLVAQLERYRLDRTDDLVPETEEWRGRSVADLLDELGYERDDASDPAKAISVDSILDETLRPALFPHRDSPFHRARAGLDPSVVDSASSAVGAANLVQRAASRAHELARELNEDSVGLVESLEAKEAARAAAEVAYRRAGLAIRDLEQRLDDERARERDLEERSRELRQEVARLTERIAESERQQSLEEEVVRLREESEDRRRRLAELESRDRRPTESPGLARRVAQGIRRRVTGPPLGVALEDHPAPWRPLERPPPAGPAGRRVLVISHMFPHEEQPGFGSFVFEQVKSLRRDQGIDARVVVGRPYWMTAYGRSPVTLWRMGRRYWRFHASCRWHELDGVPVLYLPYRVLGPFWNHGWQYRVALRARIERLRREFPYDVVHAHTAYLDGSVGRQLARRHRVPLVITEHTGPFSALLESRIVRRTTLAALEAANRVIAVSHAQAAAVTSAISPSARDRCVVVPNGVDLDLFHPGEPSEPADGPRQILFVGYFDAVKNIPLLLRAFIRVSRALPDVRLRLVGGGHEEAAVRQEIRRLGIEDRAEVVGHEPRERVAERMRSECDLLVLPSRSETFGCVLTEAMASGRPVVATRCGGPEDIVTDEHLGLLVERDDPEALAAAMRTVLTEPERFPSGRIRRSAEERFGYPSVTARLVRIYEEVQEEVARAHG